MPSRCKQPLRHRRRSIRVLNPRPTPPPARCFHSTYLSSTSFEVTPRTGQQLLWKAAVQQKQQFHGIVSILGIV